jgi:hypothetical protein
MSQAGMQYVEHSPRPENLVKISSLILSMLLVLGLVATPAAAQDVDPAVDATSEGLVHTCLRISATTPIDGLEPAALGQLLLDGVVTVELLGPDACELDSPEPKPKRSKTTPYIEFVARGAGAVISLASLAEQNDNARDLGDVDRAAKALAGWAKSQRKWLDRHPPEDCYAGVHSQWRRGVVDVRQGAKSVRRSIRSLKAKTMRNAVRKLSRGAQELVSVDLDVVSRDCARGLGA